MWTFVGTLTGISAHRHGLTESCSLAHFDIETCVGSIFCVTCWASLCGWAVLSAGVSSGVDSKPSLSNKAHSCRKDMKRDRASRGSGFRNGEYSVASTVGGYGPAVRGSHPLRGQLGLAKTPLLNSPVWRSNSLPILFVILVSLSRIPQDAPKRTLKLSNCDYS